MTIRTGLAQIDPALGLPDKNLSLHIGQAEQAAADGCDLLLFPELSLCGYMLKDMVPDLAMAIDSPLLVPLLDISRKIDLCVGFVEESPDFRFFNSYAYLAEGRIVHIHRKIYLPTYGMFEEQRYFARGDTIRAFDTRFGRLAMAVCEDLWHPSLPYLAFLDGALGVLVGSASPVKGIDDGPLPPNAAFWDRLLRHDAALYGGFIAFCNRVGVEDGISYWGGSRLAGTEGDLLAEGPLHETALVTGQVDTAEIRRARQAYSVLRDEQPEVTYRGLERILRKRAGSEEAE